MRKIFILAALIPFLFSCSEKTKSAENNKVEEIKILKEKLITLKQKITELEKGNKSKQAELNIKVNTQDLVYSEFSHFIQVTGNVKADKNIPISPETGGNIVSINVKEGNRVNKGDILAILNTEQVERNIEELKVNLDLASTKFARQENLWKQDIGSEMQYLTAKTQKQSLERKLEGLKVVLNKFVIRAPFSGIVDEIYMKKGELANPQRAILQLVNISKVYIEAEVSENHLAKIKLGDKVNLSFPAINKNTVGKINTISNIIDPANRSFKIKVNVNNNSRNIKPNLISIVKLKDYYKQEALVVPSIIVKKDFKGSYIYVAKTQKNELRAVKKYITTSMTYNNQTLINTGIQLGDKIITKGYSQIVNGSLISNKE